MSQRHKACGFNDFRTFSTCQELKNSVRVRKIPDLHPQEEHVFHSAVRSLCARAGWKEPQTDARNVYAFDLEGDLAFTLSSPDGERLLARAALLVPGAGREIAEETLAAILRVTAARFARLKAVTALDPETGTLELYAFTGLRGGDADAHETFMEDFLNELSFWKAQPVLGVPPALVVLG
jgi:hypothetical protein